MPDHGKRNIGWPKVVGQSGTARPAPLLVTSPPATMSPSVAPAVTRARRWMPTSLNGAACRSPR